MTGEMPTREQMEAVAKLHVKAAKDRAVLHKVGVALRAVGTGLVCAALIQTFYFHRKPVWPMALWFSIGIFVVSLTSVIIPNNRRFMILHAVASQAFYGVLNTEVGSSQRILYVDQGEAACTELEARYKKLAQLRKRFSFKK